METKPGRMGHDAPSRRGQFRRVHGLHLSRFLRQQNEYPSLPHPLHPHHARLRLLPLPRAIRRTRRIPERLPHESHLRVVVTHHVRNVHLDLVYASEHAYSYTTEIQSLLFDLVVL